MLFIYKKEAIKLIPKTMVTFPISYSNIPLTTCKEEEKKIYQMCDCCLTEVGILFSKLFVLKFKPLDTALKKVNGNEESKGFQQKGYTFDLDDNNIA